MGIGVVGISYKEASSIERDLVAFTASKKVEAMNAICDLHGISEVVILSTCNRTEVYFAAEHIKDNSHFVREYLVEFFQVPELEERFYIKTGRSAIIHLMRVATGLDSQIIGEDQILGQLKDAHDFAMSLGVSKKILNQTMTKVITFAKEMKTNYRISEFPLSVSSVAIRFAKEHIVNLEDANILLIGAGTINQLCLSSLASYNAKNITMCNRTQCTLEEINTDVPINIIPYEERYQVIPNMDLVISATSSPHHIIKEAHLPSLDHTVVFLDLAMPLDIEKAIKQRNNALLYDIDDFNDQSNKNLQIRNDLASEIEKAIDKKATTILRWIQQTKVDPMLASFHELCSQTQKDTMEIIRKKMQLSEKDFLFIEKMIGSSLNRVIRDPILQLKQLDNDEDIDHYKKMIHHLFDMPTKKAILLVSYGSRLPEAKNKVIYPIINRLNRSFPDYKVAQAFTSDQLRTSLSEKGIKMESVKEAVTNLIADGYETVVVQPLHIIPGSEYEKVKTDLKDMLGDDAVKILLGSPLLGDKEDLIKVAEALEINTSMITLFVGHGTNHEAHKVYEKLEETLRQTYQTDSIFVGTLEDDPKALIERIDKRIVGSMDHTKQIHLRLLLLTAGNHAMKDITGEEAHSFESAFKREGYHVQIDTRGLGELAEIQQIYTDKIDSLLRKSL